MLLGVLLQPVHSLSRETPLPLLDVMGHAGSGLRPQVLMLWKRVFERVMLVDVMCATLGKAAA
jgi:hypothetical protein